MGLSVIDLFSGAGGLSVGATSAGAHVRLMLDNDPVACETARTNPSYHGGVVVNGDITQFSGGELRDLAGLARDESVVVIGGAPCQPFSKAAYWVDPGDDAKYRRARARGESALKPGPITVARPDERRFLPDEYWRLVVELGAEGFVFENVPSILHPRNRHVIERLQSAAESLGYETTLVHARAEEYGVPQLRRRVFLLGSRAGAPEVTPATHGDGTSHPFLTAGDALKPLEPLCGPEEGEEVTGRWADELREIPPGWNYKYLTEWAGHPRPRFVAETRFWNFLLKLSPDKPSWTIAASPGPWTGPFHWDSRRLRTPELAVLQGFPLDYAWRGSRRDRIRQIGNAVPPPLAAAMVGSVLRSLEGAASRRVA